MKRPKTLDVRDIVAFAGLVMIAVGLWLYSPSIALVVVGALLIAGAVLSAELEARRPKSGGRT